MRWTWLFGVLAVAGCDDTFRQVGPGNGQTGGGTTLTGDDDDDGGTGEGAPIACDRRAAQGICEEYTGEGWDPVSIEADCSGAADQLLTETCPIEGALGGCDETRENPEGTVVWYYEGAFYTDSDRGALEDQCTSGYHTWLDY